MSLGDPSAMIEFFKHMTLGSCEATEFISCVVINMVTP